MPESIEDLIALAVSMALLWLLFGRVAVASAFRVCGIGSYGVPRPSLADYVRGPAATRAMNCRRSVMMLPTLLDSESRAYLSLPGLLPCPLACGRPKMYPGPWARQLTSSTRTPDSVWRAIFTLLPLVATVVLLPLIAFASPSDPSWIAGIYDGADGDDIVTLVDDIAGVEASSPPMIRRFHCSLHRLLTSSSDVDSGHSSSLLSRGPPWLSVLLSLVCAHASIPRQLSQPLPSSQKVSASDEYELADRCDPSKGVLLAASLMVGAACTHRDWIDRTLVTVDLTGTWRGSERGVGGGFLIGDLFLELTQQGSTVKGTLQVRGVSAPVRESVA